MSFRFLVPSSRNQIDRTGLIIFYFFVSHAISFPPLFASHVSPSPLSPHESLLFHGNPKSPLTWALPLTPRSTWRLLARRKMTWKCSCTRHAQPKADFKGLSLWSPKSWVLTSHSRVLVVINFHSALDSTSHWIIVASRLPPQTPKQIMLNAPDWLCCGRSSFPRNRRALHLFFFSWQFVRVNEVYIILPPNDIEASDYTKM